MLFFKRLRCIYLKIRIISQNNKFNHIMPV